MTRIRIAPEARNDLKGIWRYTARTWGAEQADRYISLLDSRMRVLAEDEEHGRDRSEIRPGYRSARVGSHHIFFRRAPGVLEVIRVLHQSMDQPHHLC